jgi:hypothetical protein
MPSVLERNSKTLLRWSPWSWITSPNSSLLTTVPLHAKSYITVSPELQRLKIPSSKLSKSAFDHILREHLGRLSKSYDRCVVGYGYGRSSRNTRISILVLNIILILKIDDKVGRRGGNLLHQNRRLSRRLYRRKDQICLDFGSLSLLVIQLVLIFKMQNNQIKMHHRLHTRDRESRGRLLITGEPSGGHMTCFRVGKREADGGNRDGEGGNLHIQLRRLVFVCSSWNVEMCFCVERGLSDERRSDKVWRF